ncbi:alpha/beta fold hydrolase [Palleronia caenipelagi]|uniref:Alpha/beta hydrolase n=1 Tax=Palleronia caenipelagi TaxID=2489174 RepID=A0A547Q752_9RHOB|nr:alpha/beta hydrolase [Palleronia caenipelagi]TRD22212.1 alpha/beta hydrolase [Palleronia caenipelagi]
MLDAFTDNRIALDTGITVRVRQAGDGPPLLLLHGYPQTHLCWHKVAPGLVNAGYRVILPDLRGYGDSDKPETTPDHAPYSKRAMAADQIALMRVLGHERFAVAGHDRGGRVAHRLARDYPEAVTALAVLDIAPTLHMYRTTGEAFARAYYHWFFLIQPAPMPERLIAAEPALYLASKLRAWSQGNDPAFPDEVRAEYLRCFSDPAAIHASCEDYRAAATIDLEHDEADLDRKLPMPVLALWGAKGLVGKLYDVPGIWRAHADIVEGHALPCGHFLPEESPAETLAALTDFFARHR